MLRGTGCGTRRTASTSAPATTGRGTSPAPISTCPRYVGPSPRWPPHLACERWVDRGWTCTAGSWLASNSDGIVLEQGLASALHAQPGGQVRINGHRFTVRGAAMTVSQ